jgi:6-phosphogluconate dehydrogenase
MAAALDARYLSGLKEERVAAAKLLSGPTDIPRVSVGVAAHFSTPRP